MEPREAPLGAAAALSTAIGRSRAWRRSHGADTLWSADFVIGVLVGVCTCAAAWRAPQLQESGQPILGALVAVDAALLAVALTALAILVGLMDRIYWHVLEGAGGASLAFAPYKTIVTVSGVALLVAGLGAVCWPLAPIAIRALILGGAAFLTTWATWGAVQLAAVTAEHGRLRGKAFDLEKRAAKLQEIKRAG